VKRPLPWPRLEEEAVIPNRLGTYLLAALPIITERLPGYYRYDSLSRHDVAIDFSARDYARLAADLRNRNRLDELGENARRCREQFSFDATIDPLIKYFEDVHERYSVRRGHGHTILASAPQWIQLYTRPFSLRTMFHRKAIPGRWWSRLGFGVRLARSRVRWLFARVLGKACVQRILRQCRRRESPRLGISA
jgi:hypothetical protein